MDLNGFQWIFIFLIFQWTPPDLEPMDLGVIIPMWMHCLDLACVLAGVAASVTLAAAANILLEVASLHGALLKTGGSEGLL